jgi:hypothetical protein
VATALESDKGHERRVGPRSLIHSCLVFPVCDRDRVAAQYVVGHIQKSAASLYDVVSARKELGWDGKV